MSAQSVEQPTTEELNLLRERKPGWDDAWGRLFLHLEDHVRRSTRHYTWRDPSNDVDDYISDLFLYWHRKAADGLLLAAWEGDRPVVQLLAAKGFLRNRFNDFYRARQKWMKDVELQHAEYQVKGDGSPVAIAPGEFDEQFRQLVIDREFASKSPFIREQAGLQLHPRIDWPNRAHEGLRNQLAVSIEKSQGEWPSCHETLSREHDEARQALAALIDSLATERSQKLLGGGTATSNDLDQRIDQAWANLLTRPLPAVRVASLLAIAKLNTAEQRIKRYREALPELFPELYTAYRALLGASEG